jgi:glucosyl-dolichyl phosphate glucuronosyltransferase
LGDIKVTVVICTHNRAHLLGGALQSVLRQSCPDELYEVVVVDNASTDNTAGVVKEAMALYKSLRIRLVHEPVPGIGNARNAGVLSAHGEIIGFTDDDAIVDARWIEQAIACFADDEGEVTAVGGQVIPQYEAEPPGWFPRDSEADYRGDRKRTMKTGEFPSGNNMFILKSAIVAAGGFPKLGMTESAMGYGEETALFERLRAIDEGVRFVYSPEVIIEHLIPPYKVSARYVLKRALMGGIYATRNAARLGILGRISVAARFSARMVLRVLLASLTLVFNLRNLGQWLVKYVVPIVWECGGLIGVLGVMPNLRQRPVS